MIDRDLNKLKKSKNNLILFGEVGSGKTTLLNKLCGTNYEIREGGYSCTRDIQYAFTEDKNIIIDCPGLNAAEDIIQHLKIQKYILSVIPIRIICFVIKYSTRYDLLLKNATRMLRIFNEHRKNIAIIITFSEKLRNEKKTEIQNIFRAKLGFDETKLIFSSNYIDPSDILKKINIIKSQVSNIKSIKFNEQSLLSKNEEGGLEIVEFRENKMKEYKKLINILKTLFDKEYEPIIKNALLDTMNYYKDDLIVSFKKKLQNKIQDIDTINVDSLIFGNELNEELDIIIDKYKNDLSNNQSENEYNIKITKNFNKAQYNNYILGQIKDFQIIIDLDNIDINIKKYNNNIIINNIKNNNNINNLKTIKIILIIIILIIIFI